MRPRQAGTREGSASAPDADDRHGRHPPAQRKLPPPSPSHGVQGRGARGSVRGWGLLGRDRLNSVGDLETRVWHRNAITCHVCHFVSGRLRTLLSSSATIRPPDSSHHVTLRRLRPVDRHSRFVAVYTLRCRTTWPAWRSWRCRAKSREQPVVSRWSWHHLAAGFVSEVTLSVEF